MKKHSLIPIPYSLFLILFSLFTFFPVCGQENPDYLPLLKAGDVAPDFTAADTLGNKLTLSSHKGKYVVLDFWATWCGDCRREIPELKRLYLDTHAMYIDGKPMQWISFSFDDKADAWKNMLRKEQFPWPQVSNLKRTREDQTFKDYQLRWIPAFFLLDTEGKIIGTAITADGLRKQIMKLAESKGTSLVHLWPNGAPTDNGLEGEERDLYLHVTNVTKPTLTIYRPSQAANTGVAIINCPGGGYHDVWTGAEGDNLAKWFTDRGYTYAVLKYRLPNTHREVPLDDVHEAMRLLREQEGVAKVGIMGSSAGGHLAAMAATHYNNAVERPDFQILNYPVITLDRKNTHQGTRDFLLGKDASEELVQAYSLENCVTTDTPPAFIGVSTDDDVVPVVNSIAYYQALLAKKVSVAMHIYPNGGHGWCGNYGWDYRSQWFNELEQWLKAIHNS